MVKDLKINWFKTIIILILSILVLWILYQKNSQIVIREFIRALIRALKNAI